MKGRSWLALLMLAGGWAAAGSGCGSDDKPKMILRVDAWWNESPATPEDTGYQLVTDVFWPDRAFGCFSLPADLHITANDKQAPLMLDGRCGGESLVLINGFRDDDPVTIRLEGDGQVMGQATVENLFPGAAAALVAPADGRVRSGDPLVVQMPLTAQQNFTFAEFFWMEPPPGVPPYHTSATGTLAPDGSTFQTTAPTTTGRAALVVKLVSSSAENPITSCTGFDTCLGSPNTDTIGPLFIDVGP